MGWYFTVREEYRDLAITGNGLLVYSVIAGFSQNEGGCYFGGKQYLAEICGCSVRTVITILDKLLQDGYICKFPSMNKHGKIVTAYAVEEISHENIARKENPDEKISHEKSSHEKSSHEKSSHEKISSDECKNFTPRGEKISHNNKIDNKIDNKDTLSNKGTAAFSKPSVEDVREYCQQRMNTVSPEAFVAFYESNGWKVGRNPMKDWRAAVRTWEQRDHQNPSPRSAHPLPKQESNYVTKGMAILEKIQRGEPLL